MSRGRNPVLTTTVLAALTCAAGLAHGEAARRRVVDPYYAMRAQAQGSQDSEPQLPTGRRDEVVPLGPSETTTAALPTAHLQADSPPMPTDVAAPLPDGSADDYLDYQSGLWPDGAYPAAGPAAAMPFFSNLQADLQNPDRLWGGVDYLNWRFKGMWLPPLVTTSPPGTPQSDVGVLGEPTTSILYGNERIHKDNRPGGRLNLGWWIGNCEALAIVGDYYVLERQQEEFAAASSFVSGPISTDPFLARPFFNVALNLEDSLIIAFPNFIFGTVPINLSGTVNVETTSEFHSGGLGLKKLLWLDFVHDHRFFLIGGYRFLALDESLLISHTISPTGGIFPPNTLFSAFDEFKTHSEFHGGEVGVLYELRGRRLSLQSQFKLGIGNMHEKVAINGLSSTFNGVVTITEPGGLLAQPSNIGVHRRDQLSLIPTVGVKLSFDPTRFARISVGYDFTYITRIARPGQQVDLSYNPTQNDGPIIGPSRPMALVRGTDMWLQGISAGVELRF